MKPTQFGRLLFYAEQGNYKANCMMAELYKYGIEGILQQREELRETAWYNDYDKYNEWKIEIEDIKNDNIVISQDISKENYWAKQALKIYENYSLTEPKAWISVESSWLDQESADLMVKFLVGDNEQDYNESLYLAKVASKYGMWRNNISWAWIAWHYYYGKGVKKDQIVALKWLNMNVDGYPSTSPSMKERIKLNQEIDDERINYSKISSDILRIIICKSAFGENKKIVELLNNQE